METVVRMNNFKMKSLSAVVMRFALTVCKQFYFCTKFPRYLSFCRNLKLHRVKDPIQIVTCTATSHS